jgi:hypothetical protein
VNTIRNASGEEATAIAKAIIDDGVPFEMALERLRNSASQIFADPRVRSLGIGRHRGRYGYRVVRNSAIITPESALGGAVISESLGVPVTYVNTPHEVELSVLVPHTGPGSPMIASHVLEQGRFRPVFSGLQIENYDDDVRTKVINKGCIVVGTLGCFVKLADGSAALLSNNHVVAGENRGQKGTDRMVQAGSGSFVQGDLVATLKDFVAVKPSPPNASVVAGNVVFNDVDAGIASMDPAASFRQGFHSSRSLVVPTGTSSPKVGDKVFKVGRTTGLTYGEITDISTIVGPVSYNPGPCWFQGSLTIEGDNGTMFSDKGDSGSAIVRTNGEIVGLLYAGNGTQTYACTIDSVFRALGCTLF